MSGEIEWVRLLDLATKCLTEEAVRLVAISMEELALAESLRIIHGTEGGARRYVETGGQVRFDGDGEPMIRRDAKPRGLTLDR